MKANNSNTILYKILRAAMILFWIYVGMEKLWQLEAFQIALQQQPIIGALAPLLFWLLPLLEISIGIALGLPSRRFQSWGWKASAWLIAIFTIYIGLGVLHIYEKKPCMCSSFLSNISWNKHLLVNFFILGLSVAGWKLQDLSVKHMQHRLSKITLLLFLAGILAIGAITYKGTASRAAHRNWYTPDSLDYYPEQDSVSRPIVGSLAFRYDRYAEPYRQQLFTKSLQANNFTNQLLACNTERRIALC
ncbi:MauE/DoxX family redox-associated membrane protein [Sphingobacterium sp.]|uniref:MauE/DoxX family redox-associated membrane protein n=1 Tax=Sphingobacterium sp. TaxID=341027 RepID=UPI0031D75D0B